LDKRLAFVAGLLTVFVSVAAHAQNYKNFPGASVDQKTLRAQDRAEDMYEKGEYGRALLIYKKDLAPTGDKYAQYMVGYMHLAGKSVEPDRALALAWYRLAAERGEPSIVRARDALHKSVSVEELERSNTIFVDLWQKLGDNRLILDLIRADIEVLRARTGTRIPGASTGQLTIINVSGNGGSERFYSDVHERLDTRMQYLETNVEIIDIEQDDDVADIRTLEMEIRKELAALDTL